MKIVAIIPFYNNFDDIKNCVDSLKRSRGISPQIFLIDGKCTDATPAKLKDAYHDIEILGGEIERFWTGCIAIGIREARRRQVDAVFLLNSDNEVHPDTLQKLTDFSHKNPGSIISALVLDKNTSMIRYAGVLIDPGKGKYIPIGLNEIEEGQWTNREAFETQMTWGEGVLIPLSVFDQVDPPDEITFPHYGGDADFSLRAREKGIKIWVKPNAIVTNQKPPGQIQINNLPVLKRLKFWLFDIRSHYNLKMVWRFESRHHGRPFRVTFNTFVLALFQSLFPSLHNKFLRFHYKAKSI